MDNDDAKTFATILIGILLERAKAGDPYAEDVMLAAFKEVWRRNKKQSWPSLAGEEETGNAQG